MTSRLHHMHNTSVNHRSQKENVYNMATVEPQHKHLETLRHKQHTIVTYNIHLEPTRSELEWIVILTQQSTDCMQRYYCYRIYSLITENGHCRWYKDFLQRLFQTRGILYSRPGGSCWNFNNTKERSLVVHVQTTKTTHWRLDQSPLNNLQDFLAHIKKDQLP